MSSSLNGCALVLVLVAGCGAPPAASPRSSAPSDSGRLERRHTVGQRYLVCKSTDLVLREGGAAASEQHVVAANVVEIVEAPAGGPFGVRTKSMGVADIGPEPKLRSLPQPFGKVVHYGPRSERLDPSSDPPAPDPNVLPEASTLDMPSAPDAADVFRFAYPAGPLATAAVDAWLLSDETLPVHFRVDVTWKPGAVADGKASFDGEGTFTADARGRSNKTGNTIQARTDAKVRAHVAIRLDDGFRGRGSAEVETVTTSVITPPTGAPRKLEVAGPARLAYGTFSEAEAGMPLPRAATDGPTDAADAVRVVSRCAVLLR